MAVLLDGEPYAITTISVAAKAERFVYLPVPKDCNVTVRLDSKNVINESDELNNEVTKSSTYVIKSFFQALNCNSQPKALTLSSAVLQR